MFSWNIAALLVILVLNQQGLCNAQTVTPLGNITTPTPTALITTPTPTVSPCPPYGKGPHLMDCNFDNDDICWWELVGGLQAVFLLRSGSTPSLNTGPSNDHTTGTTVGKYIYLETSVPASRNDKAQLRSRVIGTSCKPCKLNLWYHMYGSSVNRLSVAIQPINGARQTLWTKRGNQGNRWIQQSVDLISSGPYQIIIEAVVGISWTGDIAVDDITLTNCPPIPTPTPPPPCRPNMGPGDCDFEQDACRCCCWKNLLIGDRNDWTRSRGPTQSQGTGPSSDHTFGNSSGHYMYIEATNANRGFGVTSAALLVSKRFNAVTKANACFMTMWYHMKGRQVGRLRVRKQSDGAQANRYPVLFTVIRDQGDQWHNVTFDLYTSTYANDGFTVTIEARNIQSTSSDIAIDDLSFSSGCTPYFEEKGSGDAKPASTGHGSVIAFESSAVRQKTIGGMPL
ncbi:MAM and LDL-receptor class A domain-containing protein 1-like [Corticium candelabrum]|uniref:MAM and LDL-receptor class A domain-containing protein 1-like n=1 Tax=Corticium candelabrum TaxID=121492 RepID=UPI002E26DD21|nr:MAM and LDL-receptor class A domain-containing protein 1-like [Corticium candelabrum]